ncbi:MAG: DUF4342 domain-containing protein [Melioribacteraceae bacterium]
MSTNFKISSKELLQKIEELIKEGNASRIIVRDEKGKTYIDIPVTVGVIGAVFAPIVAAVGALAGMASHYTVEVVHKTEAGEDSPA